MPVPGVEFVYISRRDLDAMRHFYSDQVGLDEIWHSEDEGAVAHDWDGLRLGITADPAAVRPPNGWAIQHGWAGETVPAISCSVSITDDTWHPAVDRLPAAGVVAFDTEPVRREYRSLPVQDPMGTTVEITRAPE